jgi:hypothetical protein
MDAVLYSVLTGECVEVETTISGRVVKFTLTPEARLLISFIDPRSSEGLPSPADMPSSLCPFLRFFEDAVQFDEWKKDLPPGVRGAVAAMSVKEAFELVRRSWL